MNWGDINLVSVPTSLVGTWGIRSVITLMWGNHWVSLVCAAHDCEPQLSVQTKSALRKFKSIKPMQIVAKLLLLLSFLDFAWEEALFPNFFALHFVVWKMEIGWFSNQLSKSAQNPDSHLSIILCYYRLNPPSSSSNSPRTLLWSPMINPWSPCWVKFARSSKCQKSVGSCWQVLELQSSHEFQEIKRTWIRLIWGQSVYGVYWIRTELGVTNTTV